MAIEISNLNPAGSDLFAGEESFLTELQEADSDRVFGGKGGSNKNHGGSKKKNSNGGGYGYPVPYYPVPCYPSPCPPSPCHY